MIFNSQNFISYFLPFYRLQQEPYKIKQRKQIWWTRLLDTRVFFSVTIERLTSRTLIT